ncbi:odorant receptor 316 [Tribolium castaneum]|uniref:Odorant receptor n=1 Tax=Tribolium castaneum TaxID=7070 RepID=D2A0F9_TRICA|nr:odorant receptor 316 [Tribolium castaneum]
MTLMRKLQTAIRNLFEIQIKDDILAELLDWPTLVLFSKWPKNFAIFSTIYCVFDTLVCTLVYSTLDVEMLGKYAIFIAKSTIALCSFFSFFAKRKQYHKIINENFPHFWQLQSMGESTFDQMKKIATTVKFYSCLSVVAMLIGAVILILFTEDESEIYLSVKIYKDYVNKWTTGYIMFFYASFLYIGIVTAAVVFGLTYIVFHLIFQCFLLNQKLKLINSYIVKNGQKLVKLEERNQNFIYKELISCVKLHQRLIYFSNQINDLLYAPIFMYTFSGIVVGVALIYFLKTSIQYILTSLVLSIVSLIITTTFVINGQLLEDETENIIISLTNLPWYSLNVQNRRVVYVMLMQSQKIIHMSASGIVSLNYQLTIVLFRCIYTAMTFLVNMGL